MTVVRVFQREENPIAFLSLFWKKRMLPDKLKAHVAVADERSAKILDDRLWTQQQQSFIPHCMAHEEIAKSTPIVISAVSQIQEHEPRDVLVSLNAGAPERAISYAQFVAVLPGTLEDDADLSDALEKLKERGHECKVFDRKSK